MRPLNVHTHIFTRSSSSPLSSSSSSSFFVYTRYFIFYNWDRSFCFVSCLFFFFFPVVFRVPRAARSKSFYLFSSEEHVIITKIITISIPPPCVVVVVAKSIHVFIILLLAFHIPSAYLYNNNACVYIYKYACINKRAETTLTWSSSCQEVSSPKRMPKRETHRTRTILYSSPSRAPVYMV